MLIAVLLSIIFGFSWGYHFCEIRTARKAKEKPAIPDGLTQVYSDEGIIYHTWN